MRSREEIEIYVNGHELSEYAKFRLLLELLLDIRDKQEIRK